MTDIVDPGTISNGDTPDWDLVQAYFDAIYDVINSPGELTNANIDPAAAIAYSKLNLAGSIDAGDLDALPVCVLAQTSNVAALTYSTETWASEITDTDGMHSTSSNTSRITIQTAGVYRIQASSWYDDVLTDDGACWVKLLLNGAAIAEVPNRAKASVSGDVAGYVDVDITLACTAGLYFEVAFAHGEISAKSATKRFTATYIGPSS